MNPQVLKPSQVNKLLRTPDRRTARGRRDAALIGLMACAGLRLSEASSLRVDEIEGHRLVFKGKGQKTRTVSLPPKAVKLLRSHLDGLPRPGAFVFEGRSGPISTKQAYNRLCRHAEAAGLPAWLHPHSLRHTFASTVMRETGNLFLTQRVLGHASPQTTSAYYLRFDPTDADQAADAIQQALSASRRRTAS